MLSDPSFGKNRNCACCFPFNRCMLLNFWLTFTSRRKLKLHNFSFLDFKMLGHNLIASIGFQYNHSFDGKCYLIFFAPIIFHIFINGGRL